MKVLHIHAGGNVYGAEMVILTLVKEQIRSGIEAKVICLEQPDKTAFSERLQSEGIPIYRITSKGKIDIETLLKIKNICEQLSPHILHSHGYKTNIFLAILKRFFRKKPKLISTNHLWTKESWKIRIYEAIDALALKAFDKVVAVSELIQLEMITKGIPIKRICVIQNGVDLSCLNGSSKGKLRNELNLLNNKSILIGFIGRLSPQKGIEYLLEAASNLVKRSNIYFTLVGDGPLRKEIEHYIKINQLERRIFILGRREDVRAILNDLDIVVLPSLREGTPMVLLEAMAMGKPVVATEVGGVKDIVENLETGLLVKPCDSKALIEAIEYLLENETVRNQVSKKSYEVVRSKFSSELMSRKYVDIYTELLN